MNKVTRRNQVKMITIKTKESN